MSEYTNLLYVPSCILEYILDENNKLNFSKFIGGDDKVHPYPVEVHDNYIRFKSSDENPIPFAWGSHLTCWCDYILYQAPEEFDPKGIHVIVACGNKFYSYPIRDRPDHVAFGVYAMIKGLTKEDIEYLYPDDIFALKYLEDPRVKNRWLPETIAKVLETTGIF